MAGSQSATCNQTNARTSPRLEPQSRHPERNPHPEDLKSTDGHPTIQDPQGRAMFSTGRDVTSATFNHPDRDDSHSDPKAIRIKSRPTLGSDKHFQRALRMRDAVARVLDDNTGFLEDSGPHGHVDTAAPSHHTHWAKPRSSTEGRRSSEWETETLLDHSRGSLDMGSQPCYPCPFRQRNPVRFNIREHKECASAPFDTINGLKRHLVTCHRRRPSQLRCRRCRLEFDDEGALEDHLLLPKDQICEVVPAPSDDAEDGIMDQGRRILAAGGINGEAWSWEGIWQLLFPSDMEIPEPEFSPPVELVEVEQAFDDGQKLLKATLRDKLGLLLPDISDNDYLNFLAGQLELVFETHRVDIMKQAVARCGSGPGTDQEPSYRPNRRSRRSILLQSIRRPSPEMAKRYSRENSKSFSDRTLSHTGRSETAYSPPNQTPHAIESPTHHDPVENLQTPINHEPTQSRDPRDSGISMPCEQCGLEPCNCSDDGSASQTALGHHLNKSQESDGVRLRDKNRPHQHGRTDPHAETRRQAPNLGLTNDVVAAAPPPPTQPRLSIKTGNLDLRRAGGGIERAEVLSSSSLSAASISTFSGGRFSPESFKQRVLRQQFMGV